MNKVQAVWATQHDWCVRVEQVGQEFVVVVYADGVGSEVYQFTSFSELRNWAGY